TRSALGVGVPAASPVRWLVAAAVLVAAAGAAWWARLGPGPSPEKASAPEDARVRAALRSGKLPLPPFLMELSPGRETLMGEPAAPRAGRLSPAGVAVLEATPTFSWAGVPGARRYRVRIFTLAGEPVDESPAVAGTSWAAVRPLAAGTYQWQVEAHRDAGTVTLPGPPDTPPRFRVLDRADAARLQSLAKARPSAHVKLAVEYARAGVVDAARAELQAELADHPSRDDVRALLRSLDRR
ncbi:MAG TPA: hypothetical protein VFL12_10295, partial [Thermoanaerobaculia bacterium]|nr:hypothetical protein [Thermoanaerobaculia bacterium]